VADDAMPALILLTTGVTQKSKMASQDNYLHTVLTLLCTKYYQNWLMSVEDIANQSSGVIFEHD